MIVDEIPGFATLRYASRMLRQQCWFFYGYRSEARTVARQALH
jgi:hypothetical protein